MVLLDWEKAFDKVDREGLKNAINRIGVHPKLQRLIDTLYKQTDFKVEMEGRGSEWTKQKTGIRQGCPLSPYLFLIVMTVLFHDIHKELDGELIKHRIPGANFDEVMYADDTICISTDTRTMNKFLASIEQKGKKLGLKLNKTKCEVMTTTVNADIHFEDGTPVPKKEAVTYLGCELGVDGNMQAEVGKRLSKAYVTLQKLDLFWRHSSCPKKFKIIVLNAVLRTKIMYGIDSAQLNEGELKKLDQFQLKGLRKILKLNTTYINRENTNKEIIERANRETQNTAHPHKKVIPFRQTYLSGKMKRLKRLLDNQNEDTFTITYKNTLCEVRIPPNRLRQRPKYKWADRVLLETWDDMKEANTEHRYNNTKFKPGNEEHVQAIKTHLENRA